MVAALFCFVPSRKCMYFCANFTELGLKGGLLFTKTKHNKCFSNIWASQSKKRGACPSKLSILLSNKAIFFGKTHKCIGGTDNAKKILHKIISIVKENWLFCPWKEGFMRKKVRQWITLILAVVMIVGAVNNDYLITLATNADEVGTEAVSGNDAVEMQDVSGNAVAELASVSGNNDFLWKILAVTAVSFFCILPEKIRSPA